MIDLFKTVIAISIVGFFIGIFACVNDFRYNKEKWLKDMTKIVITFVFFGVGIHLLGGFNESNNGGWTNLPGRWGEYK